MDKEVVDIKMKIKKAIHIKCQRSLLNRDEGYESRAINSTTGCHVTKQTCNHVTTRYRGRYADED